jgi:hypothetical protein
VIQDRVWFNTNVQSVLRWADPGVRGASQALPPPTSSASSASASAPDPEAAEPSGDGGPHRHVFHKSEPKRRTEATRGAFIDTHSAMAWG